MISSLYQEIHLLTIIGIIAWSSSFTSTFQYELGTGVFFGFTLLCFNHFDHDAARYPHELNVSHQINIKHMQLTLASLLSNNLKVLQTLRYLTWMFTFPRLLQLDMRVRHPSKQYQLFTAQVLSNMCFCFTLLNEYFPHFIVTCLIGVTTLAFSWYYNSFLSRKYRRTSFINIMWVLYGIVYMVYKSGIITEHNYVSWIITMDSFSKLIFTFSYQFLLVKSLPNNYSMLKVLRIVYPVVQTAIEHNMLNKDDALAIQEYLDISKDNIDEIKEQILEELFPNHSWQGLVLPLKKIANIHARMGILFCDLVSYTTYSKSHTLHQLVNLVDNFYVQIDMIVKKHNVQKVETIGDAYLIVSENVFDLALSGKSLIEAFGERIRVGIHIGEVAECTLGITKLRHAFVGHSVNIASRLESQGVPGKIHISEEIASTLQTCPTNRFELKLRDPPVVLKGVDDPMNTYFLSFS